MTLLRLRGRKNVERLRRRGEVWRGKHMKIVYLLVYPKKDAGGGSDQKSAISGQIFVGTLASVHLEKSAVKRNRMRRRCREALRIVLSADRSSPPTRIELLLVPRSSTLDCAFGDIVADVRAFLTHLSHHGR